MHTYTFKAVLFGGGGGSAMSPVVIICVVLFDCLLRDLGKQVSLLPSPPPPQ